MRETCSSDAEQVTLKPIQLQVIWTLHIYGKHDFLLSSKQTIL